MAPKTKSSSLLARSRPRAGGEKAKSVPISHFRGGAKYHKLLAARQVGFLAATRNAEALGNYRFRGGANYLRYLAACQFSTHF